MERWTQGATRTARVSVLHVWCRIVTKGACGVGEGGQGATAPHGHAVYSCGLCGTARRSA